MKTLWFVLIIAVMVVARPQTAVETLPKVGSPVNSQSEPGRIGNFQPSPEFIKAYGNWDRFIYSLHDELTNKPSPAGNPESIHNNGPIPEVNLPSKKRSCLERRLEEYLKKGRPESTDNNGAEVGTLYEPCDDELSPRMGSVEELNPITDPKVGSPVKSQSEPGRIGNFQPSPEFNKAYRNRDWFVNILHINKRTSKPFPADNPVSIDNNGPIPEVNLPTRKPGSVIKCFGKFQKTDRPESNGNKWNGFGGYGSIQKVQLS